MILDSIQALGREAGLHSFEQVRNMCPTCEARVMLHASSPSG